VVWIGFSCSDLNGDAVTVLLDGAPSSGSAELTGASDVRYTPGSPGRQTLRVRPSDGTNVGAPATGTIEVNPLPTQPPPGGKAPLPNVVTKTLRPDRRRRVRLKLACPASAPVSCTGRVRIRTRIRRRTYTVLSYRYTIAAGARASRRVRLSRPLVKALRRARRASGTVRLSAPSNGTLAANSATATIRLRRR
jgi:hypothetical protein